jgi:thioredoxin 1
MKIKFVVLLTVFLTIFLNCKSENNMSAGKGGTSVGAVIQLTNAGFKKMIFNYTDSKDWKYEGSKPAIIDFYADWCPPCRQLSPLVEEVAKEYGDKIVVYKVNTDSEKELASSLGITNLPTLLFIPAQGKPRASMGYIPKENLVKAINEILLVK